MIPIVLFSHMIYFVALDGMYIDKKLDRNCYFYDGYMDDYLSCILVNIVGWPRKWCYCRFLEEKSI